MRKMIAPARPWLLAGGFLLAATRFAAAATTTPAAAPIAAPDAPAAPIAGPRLTSQSFGAWFYRCQETMVEGKPGHPACALDQQVTVQQDGKTQMVMDVVIAPAADGKSHNLAVLVPLGMRLQPGLRLGVDDGAPQTVPFDYCDQRGCWVAGVPWDASLAAMKAGRNGIAKLVLVNGREVSIEFPLTGFAPALAALDANPAPVTDAAKPADPKAKPKK